MKPTNHGPIQAVLYCRFSDRPDAESCESCDHQLVDLRAFCERRGFQIAGEFHDDALSGGDGWETRTGMLAAVEVCKRGMIFLVRSWDRLFRSVERASVFRSMLHGKGVRVMSSTSPAEGSQGNRTPSEDQASADLMRNIMLAIAEYERQIIRARTSRAMKKHQENGRRMGSVAPIGTSVDPNDESRLIEDPEEQKTIDLICRFHGKGLSSRGIARALDDLEIPARDGGRWRHTTILRVLRRAGVIED